MRINKKTSGFILTLIIILSLAVSTFYMASKQGFHEDELLTYKLSNSSEALNIGGWNSPNDFNKYLSVSKHNRFDYDLVYENQKTDGVHPPLYYILIHTVCSLFPEVFSKWFAYGINFLSMAGSLVLLYFLAKKISDSRLYSLIATGAYALSIACITTTVYLRMYSLLTLLVLAFLYIIQRLYEKKASATVADYVTFALIVTLGTLTHYYFILFEVLTGIVFLVFMVKETRRSDLLKYIICTAVGSAVALCFYPYIISNVISGNRGLNSFQLAIDFITLVTYVLYKIFTYIEILTKELFLNKIWLFVICNVCVVGYGIYRRFIKKKKLSRKVVLVAFPMIVFFAGIVILSPFNSDRYIMACLPLIVMLYTFAFAEILKSFMIQRYYIILSVSILAVSVISLASVTPYYIYGKTKLYEPVTDDCVFVGTSMLEWNKCIDKLMQYNNTMIVQTDKFDPNLAPQLENFALKRGIKTGGRISEITNKYMDSSMKGESAESLSYLKNEKSLDELDSVTVYISRLSDGDSVIKYITENTKFRNYELIQEDYCFEDYYNWYDYFVETESYCNVYRFY